MKKLFTCILTLMSFLAIAQTPFTPGNLVVTRVGSGNASLSNKSDVINIVEMTTAGTVVQTITLPYTASMLTGSNNKICAQGSSSNDANLTLSSDGKYFVLGGYNSDTGIATISGVAGTKRVVCRIAMNGTWDTQTLLDTAKSKGNIRCVASKDGSGFWIVGSTLGTRYVPYLCTGNGTDTAVSVSTTVTNCRTIQPFGGDLIIGTGSGAVRVGKLAGFPTTNGNTITALPGVPATITANSIYMTSLPGGPAGLNTMYVASDASAGGIKKYCLNSSTSNWDSVGTLEVTTVLFRGLTGSTNGSTVTLYGIRSTSPNLVSFVDATGYNVAPTATSTTVSTQPTNTAYRGVQLVPGVIFPIRLLAFNASKNDNGTAKVFWVVNGNDDAVSYVVEKSNDGKTFSSFGNIAATNKNNYEFNDNTVLTTTTYYRLKFVGKNGAETYSNVVSLTPLKSIKLDVFPNPSQNNLVVSYPKLSTDANISIHTFDGKNVMSVAVKANTTQCSIDISKLNKMDYIVTFLDAEGNKTSKTIIKN